MGILEALILGIVEGITEFLPVSSTGHLILAGELLQIPPAEFLKSFDIAIQLGAILAAVALYVRSFFDIEILKRLFLSFLPTGIIGFTVYPYAKATLLGNESIVLAALFFGGITLIVFEMLYKTGPETVHTIRAISYPQAVCIGCFQALAIIPGVSRSAATIVGGLRTTGISRVAIVEYSFLLAVPTMVAATLYDLLKNAGSFSRDDISALAVGFVTSFFVAILSIRWLLTYVRTHSFISFGIYRILVAALFFIFLS